MAPNLSLNDPAFVGVAGAIAVEKTVTYGGTWTCPPTQNECNATRTNKYGLAIHNDIFSLADAADGDLNTDTGHGYQPDDGWLMVDVGETVSEKPSVKYHWRHNGAGAETMVFKLETSTDNITWTTRETHTASGSYDTPTVSYLHHSVEVTFRYMRLIMSGGAGRPRWTGVWEFYYDGA